jgi:hypothetical protein
MSKSMPAFDGAQEWPYTNRLFCSRFPDTLSQRGETARVWTEISRFTERNYVFYIWNEEHQMGVCDYRKWVYRPATVRVFNSGVGLHPFLSN